MNKIIILLVIFFLGVSTFFLTKKNTIENNEHQTTSHANSDKLIDSTDHNTNSNKINQNQKISIHILRPLLIHHDIIIKINTDSIIDKSQVTLITNNLPIDFTLKNNKIYFKPNKTGIHKLTITTHNKTSFSLYIEESHAFNPDHIQVFNGADELEQALGLITNQFWVSSSSLQTQELQNLIQSHSLSIVGKDEYLGFLIEIDPDNGSELMAIKQLKQSPEVDYVFQRLYEGGALDRLEKLREPFYPNDYSSWSMGHTENWHLVRIEAPKAWSVTTGNPDIHIGIADGGFDTSHPELAGRIAINFYSSLNEPNEAQISHGTAVAGAIGASGDNQYGMTGLNFHSPLVLHQAGFRQWVTLAKQPKVKVISASWAIPGHIPKKLNLGNANEVKDRAENAFKLSRSFRAIAEKNPDKLFIFSAGNGIGNGQGHKGQYAVEGRLHSPALHLSSANKVDKLPNVLFVAALTAKGALSFTSTYGNLVDIAAPAYYKSLAANNGFKTDGDGKYGINGGFKGTSSAAPVVAGVASLIYSINPNLKGHEVKAIILEAAQEKVNERFNSPKSKNKDRLNHPLPILNANRAVFATYKYLKQNTKFSVRVADPVKRTIAVTKNGKTQTFYQLEEETDELILQDAGEEEEIDLEEIVADESQLIMNALKSIKIGELSLNIKDRKTQQPINEATVTIALDDKLNNASSSIPHYTFQLEGARPIIFLEGQYLAEFSHPDYQPLKKIIRFKHNQKLTEEIFLTPLHDSPLPQINGQVTNIEGTSINNAEVSVILEKNFSSPVATTQTDNDGQFILELPQELIDQLDNCSLLIDAEFFSSQTVTDLSFDKNNETSVLIQLTHESHETNQKTEEFSD